MEETIPATHYVQKSTENKEISSIYNSVIIIIIIIIIIIR